MAARRSVEVDRDVELARAEAAAERATRTQGFVLGIISLGAGIPITAIAGVNREKLRQVLRGMAD